MKAKIFCTISNHRQYFYLKVNGQQYFLFQQTLRRDVNEYFKNGVSLNQVFSFPHSRKDSSLKHTITKLPTYIKYIEKEYSIAVLKQTARKNEKRRVA